MAEFLKSALVTMTCATVEATIHYTNNGDNPTSESTIYTDSFTLYKNATLKAIGVKSGINDSSVRTYEVTIKLPQPLIDVSTDTDEKTLTLTNSDQYVSQYGTVTFRYTLDGTDPTETSEEFTSGMVLDINGTFKVRAFADANTPSDVLSLIISGLKVSTPTIRVVEGQ